MKKLIILGIETSCDETSAAVVEIKKSFKFQVLSFKILSNIILSQINIHKKYGGIVPEVAARNHVKNIIPVINAALKTARVKPKNIDRIAVTRGPGLITSLLVGVEAARTLAYVWRKPIVGVDHIKGHAYAAYLKNCELKYPALALIVSGGHTELLLMKNPKSFKKIGQTLDDAAGEAFDKVAKLLGLGFPGGPAISKIAKHGDSQAFDFPRPMIHSKDYNFSFSGLKTAVLYTVNDLKKKQSAIRLSTPSSRSSLPLGLELGVERSDEAQASEPMARPRGNSQLCNLSSSFQKAVVEVLVIKTMRAAQKHKVKTLILGGGVAANILLRETLKSESKKLGVAFIVPGVALCTDNAAPIAVAGYFGKPAPWEKLKVDQNLER